MSILIKGMEMPQEKKITLTIFPDGRVYENHGERLWGHGKDCIPWKAVSVPPHGDLIDRDPFIEFIKTHWDGYDQWVVGQLEARPTIIPAEEGETVPGNSGELED